DRDRQHDHCTRWPPHGDVVAEWAGADGRRSRRRWRYYLGKRGTIRSGDWNVDGDRQHGYCTFRPRGDVAAEWAGALGWRLKWHSLLGKCGTIRSGDWTVDGYREHGHCALPSHRNAAALRQGNGGGRSA